MDVYEVLERAAAIHEAITVENKYEGVWALLEPVARDQPGTALRNALVGVGSPRNSVRAVSADLLGLVAGLHPSRRDAVVRALLAQSRVEQDEDVRWSLAFASAHSNDPRTLPALEQLSHSSDRDVRYQVVQAAVSVADRHTKDAAARLVTRLSTDTDDHVRQKALDAMAALASLR